MGRIGDFFKGVYEASYKGWMEGLDRAAGPEAPKPFVPSAPITGDFFKLLFYPLYAAGSLTKQVGEQQYQAWYEAFKPGTGGDPSIIGGVQALGESIITGFREGWKKTQNIASESLSHLPDESDIDDLPPLVAEPSKTRSNELEDLYIDKKGKAYAREVARRLPTRLMQLDYLKKQIEHEPNQAMRERMEARLRALTDEMNVEVEGGGRLLDLLEEREDLMAHDALWIKSTHMRQEVASKGAAEASEKASAGLTNAREHRLFDGSGKLLATALRFGVISDMTNGYFSLEELGIAKRSPTYKELLISRILADIEKGHKGLFGRNTPLTDQEIASANDALRDLDQIDLAILKRRERLQSQMVQYFQAQVEARAGEGREFDPEKSLQFVDLRLLHLGTRKVEKGGLLHDETVEYKDQLRMMREFNGKYLVADSNGPFIDEKGNVHLPKIPGLREGEQIAIQTHQLLIGPSGHKKHAVGEALDAISHNVDALRSLQKVSIPQEGVDALTQKKDDNWQASASVAKALMEYAAADSNFLASIGCFSAKDRTGAAVGYAMHSIREELGTETGPADRRFLRESKLATAIAAENTPKVRVLKVNPQFLLKGGYQGMTLGDRIREAAKLIRDLVFPKAANLIRKKEVSSEVHSTIPAIEYYTNKLMQLQPLYEIVQKGEDIPTFFMNCSPQDEEALRDLGLARAYDYGRIIYPSGSTIEIVHERLSKELALLKENRIP